MPGVKTPIIFNAAQFHFLPTSEGKDVIVERTASVGTDIEGLASVGCVGNVILGQFLYGSKNRVGTTGAKCRMKREVAHQMSSYILNT